MSIWYLFCNFYLNFIYCFINKVLFDIFLIYFVVIRIDIWYILFYDIYKVFYDLYLYDMENFVNYIYCMSIC